MKITKQQLRSIVAEEVKKAVSKSRAKPINLDGVTLTSKSGAVIIDGAYVESMDPSFGELRIEYSGPGNHYGDRTLLKILRLTLLKQGMSPAAVADIDFSEAGMQGDGYMSFDVGEAFLSEWPQN